MPAWQGETAAQSYTADANSHCTCPQLTVTDEPLPMTIQNGGGGWVALPILHEDECVGHWAMYPGRFSRYRKFLEQFGDSQCKLDLSCLAATLRVYQ